MRLITAKGEVEERHEAIAGRCGRSGIVKAAQEIELCGTIAPSFLEEKGGQEASKTLSLL